MADDDSKHPSTFEQLKQQVSAQRANVLDVTPALKAKEKARVRALAQGQNERDLETLKGVAAVLAAAGFPDDEVMRLLGEVEASIQRQAAKAIDETMMILSDEGSDDGVDGLRRRLDEKR
jgi:ParB-like chromosome segregation protein Spo0J